LSALRLSPPIVVVGAGIVGASIAYHLARLGQPVTLLERASAPASGVTGQSFAWIGDSAGDPADDPADGSADGSTGGDWPGGAEDLRHSVLRDWHRLEAEVPGIAVRWTGSLAWTRVGDGAVPQPGQTWIDRDRIRSLEPNLRTVPDRAVHTPTDGAVDPVAATRSLIRAARRLGVEIVFNADVTTLPATPTAVTAAGAHSASTIVLAAGTEVTTLAGSIGASVPVIASPALLVRVAAPAGLVRTIVATPDFEARELSEGHLLLTAPLTAVGTLGPDLVSADGTAGPSPGLIAQWAIDRLRSTFRNSDGLCLLGWTIGRRPMPPQGPQIGYLTPDRSIYVAVMHSAVTLSPTAGRLIAMELATGRPSPGLERCRPRPAPK
jgi:glycine/D-amino acid oxidase-like deaminating enzyme